MSATRSSWAICCSSWFPHDMWQPKCRDIKIDSIFEAVLGDLATIQQWCYNGGISKFSLPWWILELGVPNSCFCVGSSTMMSASALQIGLFASYQAIPRAVKLVKETPKGVGESPLETLYGDDHPPGEVMAATMCFFSWALLLIWQDLWSHVCFGWNETDHIIRLWL